jgi:hypothetical protein
VSLENAGAARPFQARWLRIVGCVALFVALVLARALYSARTEWQAAQRALEHDRAAVAVLHLRRAASWHVPGSPYTPRALQALADLERRELARGRSQGAQQAQRARLSAQHSARPVWRALPMDPSPFWSLAALGGWLGFCAASLALVLRGLDAEGQLTPYALPALLALVGSFVLLAVGLMWA